MEGEGAASHSGAICSRMFPKFGGGNPLQGSWGGEPDLFPGPVWLQWGGSLEQAPSWGNRAGVQVRVTGLHQVPGYITNQLAELLSAFLPSLSSAPTAFSVPAPPSSRQGPCGKTPLLLCLPSCRSTLAFRHLLHGTLPASPTQDPSPPRLCACREGAAASI